MKLTECRKNLKAQTENNITIINIEFYGIFGTIIPQRGKILCLKSWDILPGRSLDQHMHPSFQQDASLPHIVMYNDKWSLSSAPSDISLLCCEPPLLRFSCFWDIHVALHSSGALVTLDPPAVDDECQRIHHRFLLALLTYRDFMMICSLINVLQV